MSGNVLSVSKPVPVNLHSSPLSQVGPKPKETVQIQRGLTKSRVDAFERKLSTDKHKSPYEISATQMTDGSSCQNDESCKLGRSHSRVKSGIAAFETIDGKSRTQGIFSAVSMSSLAARFHGSSPTPTQQSRISTKSSLPVISTTSSQTGTTSHKNLRRLRLSESVQRLREKISFRMLVRTQQAATLEPLPPSPTGDSDSEESDDDFYYEGSEKEQCDEFEHLELEAKIKKAREGNLDIRIPKKPGSFSSGEAEDYHLEHTITFDIYGSGSSGGSEFFSKAAQDTALLSTNALSSYTEPSSQADLALSPSSLSMIQKDNQRFASNQRTLAPRGELNRAKSWTQLYAAASDEDSHWNKPFLDRYIDDHSGQAFHDDYLSKHPAYYGERTTSSSRYTSANTTRFHLPSGPPSRKGTRDSIKPTLSGIQEDGLVGPPQIVSTVSGNSTLRRGSKSLDEIDVRKSSIGSIGELSFYNRVVDAPFGSEEGGWKRKESWQARYDSCVVLPVESGPRKVQGANEAHK
ncbi:hypothetical protein BJ508DRAFT_131721 [Ascobolus immersus RN42]|uniref:Uncharacterized protein n=1 Tax=Ascobolus immersus RN42 TaxID=1160509 RepID=A0A3N4I1Q2_ASCIM|nr:hypothetical protein BJ508DRAFT_131721 [Ascobolus immersus RN42]